MTETSSSTSSTGGGHWVHARRLYVVASVVIGIVALVNYVTVNAMMRQQRDHTAEIEVNARQYMLGSHIALLASEMVNRLTDDDLDSLRREIISENDLFQQAHQVQVHDVARDELSEDLRRLFFGPIQLDGNFHLFFQAALDIASAPDTALHARNPDSCCRCRRRWSRRPPADSPGGADSAGSGPGPPALDPRRRPTPQPQPG